MTNRRQKRPAKPLDSASLRELAFAYVARFATSRAKLSAYLARKIRERSWADAAAPDILALAEDMVARGFIDDAGYAEMKAGSLLRRGYGRRRVAQMYHGDGIDEADRGAADALVAGECIAAIVALARRRHFGPFAMVPPDDKARQRALAACMRAGHDFALAKRLLDLGGEYRDEALEEILAEP